MQLLMPVEFHLTAGPPSRSSHPGSSFHFIVLQVHQMASAQTEEYLAPSATGPASFTPYHFRMFVQNGPGGYYSNSFVTGDDIRGMSILGSKYPPGLHNRPMMVLTDGNCFSACAIFTHVMRKKYGTKIVTVGGLLNQSMSASSSCLGFVEGSMQDVVAGLQGKIQGLPKPFQVRPCCQNHLALTRRTAQYSMI